MDDTMRALVADRVRGYGYTRAWKRASGGDELLILVPAEEYDAGEAAAIEAELVPLVRKKVWVTYWRENPGETEELFDARETEPTVPGASAGGDEPVPEPQPFGPDDRAFLAQLRGKALGRVDNGARQTLVFGTDALVSIGAPFVLDGLEIDPASPHSLLRGALGMTALMGKPVVDSMIDAGGALVLRFEGGSMLSVPPSATRDAFDLEIRAGEVGTVASQAGGRLLRWMRPVRLDRARRGRVDR